MKDTKQSLTLTIGKIVLRVRGQGLAWIARVYDGFVTDAKHCHGILELREVPRRNILLPDNIKEEVRKFPVYFKHKFFAFDDLQKPHLTKDDLKCLFADPLFRKIFFHYKKNSTTNYLFVMSRSVIFFDPGKGRAYLFLFKDDLNSIKDGQKEAALYFLFPKLSIFHGGLFLHSAGVLSAKNAYLFVGTSGSGKSTVTKKSGNRVILSDDVVGIQRHNGRFDAFATPWGTYRRQMQSWNLRGPVHSVFFLHKDSKFFLKRLKASEAIIKSLPPTLSRYTTEPEFRLTFELLSTFFRQYPALDMHSSKEQDIWQYVSKKGEGDGKKEDRPG
ncbi:MAG: hypothetical protein C4540_06435 [Candidatus Omnitrophota bacterium]|jgi:hypothetical protein|nr:MAG: hypothetical protein C4540_06435 [Candidatus Omnitrophota bacterium]